MVGVDGFDQGCGAVHIAVESLHGCGLGAERAGLVADLPGIDGIRPFVTLYHLADVLLIEFDGLCVLGEGGHCRHIDVVSVGGGMRLAACAGLLEIRTITILAPLPGIVKEEHSLHLAAGELAQQRIHTIPVFVGGKDADIVDTIGFQGIQFGTQTLRLAYGDAGSIPHVGPYEIAGRVFLGCLYVTRCH